VIRFLQKEKACGEPNQPFPLLMFLDLNMPRCTGFGVLDWLRQQPELQDLPTIVFSSSEEGADIERSFQLGAQGYWVKPSRFEDLVQMMVQLKEILYKAVRRVEDEDPMPVAA
jgi:CheY-like chemotaxis protein